MEIRKIRMTLRRSGGVLIALGGISLIVKTLPLYLWPLLLGIVFIWLGWHLYTYKHNYW